MCHLEGQRYLCRQDLMCPIWCLRFTIVASKLFYIWNSRLSFNFQFFFSKSHPNIYFLYHIYRFWQKLVLYSKQFVASIRCHISSSISRDAFLKLHCHRQIILSDAKIMLLSIFNAVKFNWRFRWTLKISLRNLSTKSVFSFWYRACLGISAK